MSTLQTRESADYDEGQLIQLVTAILDEAGAQGASAAEAGLSVESGFSVTVRMGQVETVEHNRDKGIAVTVYFGHRKASASTSDFSAAAVRDTVRAACSIARYTAEDTCARLADAEHMARDVPDLDLCHPWGITMEEAIAQVTACEDAARRTDGRIVNSEGATVSSHTGYLVYGNTHGFVHGYPSSQHGISCAVIGEEGGNMQRDYWYTVARDHHDLEPAESVGKRAAQRTLRRLNARRLKTGRVPVVFAAEIATGLVGAFVSAIRGSNLYRRSSFLLDHLGKQVFPAHMHLYETPHVRKGLGSAPFDNEGVATRARDLVRDGILQSYVLDTYSACKLGMETTGNAGGVHNLHIGHGRHDQAGLLREMGTGMLITELMGQGVNMVTGDYSRGAAGFWVEGGEIQYPVEEITVAGNLRDMLMHIVAVGNDIELRGNIRTGSLFIEAMTVAGE